MKANDKDTGLLTESLQETEQVDRSRRSFGKVGIVTPVILTLASKTALGQDPGYWCSRSGGTSGNTSSHGPKISCAVGYSPGGWWKNACKLHGDPDGGLDDWTGAGFTPFDIQNQLIANVWTGQIRYLGNWITCSTISTKTKTKTSSTSSTCTGLSGCDTWCDIFNFLVSQFKLSTTATFNQSAPTFSGIFGAGSSGTLWEVMNANHGGLEWQAAAAYLNASLNAKDGRFNPAYSDITPQYIINIYNDPNLSLQQKIDYFTMIQHQP